MKSAAAADRPPARAPPHLRRDTAAAADIGGGRRAVVRTQARPRPSQTERSCSWALTALVLPGHSYKYKDWWMGVFVYTTMRVNSSRPSRVYIDIDGTI